MINFDNLKRKFALSAIKGELTIHDDFDSASDLYNRIIFDRQNHDKKFKICDSLFREPPFSIPKNWMWCNLSNISSIVVGATPSTSNASYWNGGTIPWIPSGACHDCLVTKNSKHIKMITQLGYDNCSTTLMAPNTTLLALTGATAGRVGFLTFEACANQSVVGVLADTLINPKYVYYSFFARKQELLDDCVGSAQPHFSKDYVTKMVFPLPPMKEQEKIVAKLDAIFDELDKIETNSERLSSLQEKFMNKILRLALQGKLTNQINKEGTGDELLASILNERSQAVKEGKIKKDKPFDKINSEEIPFDIPKTWIWARLGMLGDSVKYPFADGPFGSNLKQEHYTLNKEVRIIQLSNVGKDGWKNDNEKYTSFNHLETIKRSEVDPGDIVIAKMMPAGRAIIVPDLGTKFVLSSDCVKFVPHKFLDEKYLYYAINSEVFRTQVLSETNGIGRERTSLSKLKEYILPLPPYEEQKRIVRAIEEFKALVFLS